MDHKSWALGWRTAQTPTASTVHEPVGKPGGPGLWHHKNLQLPPYIQHVANDLRGQGHGESEAVQMAVGIVRDWAAGHDGKGNKVHPDVQAAAAKNIAQWEALKARTGGVKRFDPYHKGSGPGGGQFTSGGNSGSGAKKPAASKPPAQQAKPASGTAAHPGEAGRKRALLRQAAADRAKARGLEAELRLVEAQIHAATAAHAKAVTSAKKAQAAAKAKHHKKATTVTHHHTVTHHAATLSHLHQRASTLRAQISTLLHHARALAAQAAAIRSGAGWQVAWAAALAHRTGERPGGQQ